MSFALSAYNNYLVYNLGSPGDISGPFDMCGFLFPDISCEHGTPRST